MFLLHGHYSLSCDFQFKLAVNYFSIKTNVAMIGLDDAKKCMHHLELKNINSTKEKMLLLTLSFDPGRAEGLHDAAGGAGEAVLGPVGCHGRFRAEQHFAGRLRQGHRSAHAVVDLALTLGTSLRSSQMSAQQNTKTEMNTPSFSPDEIYIQMWKVE